MRLAWLRDFAAVPPGAGSAAARIHLAHARRLADRRLRQGGDAVPDAARRRSARDAFDRGRAALLARAAFPARLVGRSASARSSMRAGATCAVFFAQWLDRSRRTAAEDRPSAGWPDIRRDSASRRARASAAGLSPARARSRSRRDGTENRSRAAGDAAQEFSFETQGRPRAMTIDPTLRVFRRLDPREIPPIVRQVTLDPRPRWCSRPGAEVRDAANRSQTADGHGAPADTGEPPILMIGLADDVDAWLAQRGLPARPGSLNTRQRASLGRPTAQRQDAARRLGARRRLRCRPCCGRCRTMAGRAGWCSTARRRSIAACGRPNRPALGSRSKHPPAKPGLLLLSGSKRLTYSRQRGAVSAPGIRCPIVQCFSAPSPHPNLPPSGGRSSLFWFSSCLRVFV